MDLNEFLSINPGINCNLLQIGQVVCIEKGNTQHKSYTVKSGDTCYAIAKSFNLNLNDLYVINPGLNCLNLQIGQVIYLSGENNNPTDPSHDEDITPTSSDLITYDQFVTAVNSCGYPTPSYSLFEPFITRATRDGKITTKRELAMFLANILHESGGLIYKREIRCENNGCPGDYRTQDDVPGVYYYGRGFIQLTWAYNYRDASIDLFGDDRLMRNPDLVAQHDDYSWAVSFWFWKSRVHSYVQGGQFGASIKQINGGLECGPCRAACPQRISNYMKILRVFGVQGDADVSGC